MENARSFFSLAHIVDAHSMTLSRRPFKTDTFPILYDLYDLCDLAHVAGWKPYNLHDLHSTFFLGWVCLYCYKSGDPAQPLTTAGKKLDALSVDR